MQKPAEQCTLRLSNAQEWNKAKRWEVAVKIIFRFLTVRQELHIFSHANCWMLRNVSDFMLCPVHDWLWLQILRRWRLSGNTLH